MRKSSKFFLNVLVCHFCMLVYIEIKPCKIIVYKTMSRFLSSHRTLRSDSSLKVILVKVFSEKAFNIVAFICPNIK